MGRPRRFSRLPQALLVGIVLLAAGLAGCRSSAPVQIPDPRTIIVSSGERIRVDSARMDAIYEWVTAENENIEMDPAFLIVSVPAARESLPWETLTIEGDTARVQYDRAHPDIVTLYNIYAHLHLMKRMGRLEEFLPEHADAEGYELERAIVERIADAWLLGRAVLDAPAYEPLDQITYAHEAGYLDAYLLVSRGEEFPEARVRWEQENPGELDEYSAWFERVFESDPPGYTEEADSR